MKYEVGQKVKIKSLDWYKENKDNNGEIKFENGIFTTLKSTFLGQIMTIEEITLEKQYILMEDKYKTLWTDEMIEGLVEDENNNCENCGLIRNSTRCLFMDNCPHNKQKNIIEIPENYVLKDENSNVINATKIVLEKKKKEYPKTYEECYKIMGVKLSDCYIQGYKSPLLEDLQELLICRDAYWKIAGEEMGLGKPWEPDWDNVSDKYCIYFVSGNAWSKECQTRQCPFAFPTPEMRDAFYENFKEDIEICKELL